MMKLKVFRHASTAIAVAAAAIALTGAAASAATSPPAAASAPLATTCRAQVQNPHASTHVPGTMNVVATASCTASVPHIALFVTLYDNGAYASSGANDVYFTSSDSVNAATLCRLGHYYYATAKAEIWFPSGPPQWTNVVNSPTVLNDSCVGGSA